jgi:hypothetical protein
VTLVRAKATSGLVPPRVDGNWKDYYAALSQGRAVRRYRRTITWHNRFRLYFRRAASSPNDDGNRRTALSMSSAVSFRCASFGQPLASRNTMRLTQYRCCHDRRVDHRSRRRTTNVEELLPRSRQRDEDMQSRGHQADT